MQTIQVARAPRVSAVKIVKTCICEVEEGYNPGNVDPFHIHRRPLFTGPAYDDIAALGRISGYDFALELRGKKLWLFSVSVR